MGANIKGVECSLGKIFSPEFCYEIPSFQRPYAWTTDQTDELFHDLLAAYEEGDEAEYFLGSIVLIKTDESNICKVIDGQQRLTTLTILLALIASKLSDDEQKDFHSYVITPAKRSQNIPERPALKLRKKDQPFFEKYVQKLNFHELFSAGGTLETEAQLHITENARLLNKYLDEHFATAGEIAKFGSFVISKCYLISVSTNSEESACRIFSVLNSRGLSLLPTDIIKADVISRIDEPLQDRYNERWEEIENDLGREEFLDLFYAIRTIVRHTKAHCSIQDEFKKYILSESTSQEVVDFINNKLEPYAESFEVVTKRSYEASTDSHCVNNLLFWMNQSGFNDWLPVAMRCYVLYKDKPQIMLRFLEKLERLVAFMCLEPRWNFNRRTERLNKVLADLEALKDNEGEFFGKYVELSLEEKLDFIKLIGAEVYKMTGVRRRYLLLRLESFISGNGYYEDKKFTVDQILPPTVQPGSEWELLWPREEDRENWVNKLGNLVPLPRSRSSAAQKYSFTEKKDKYYTDRNGRVGFKLTSSIMKEMNWTRDKVIKRHKELFGILAEKWGLGDALSEETRMSLRPQRVLSSHPGRGGSNTDFIVTIVGKRFVCDKRGTYATGYFRDDRKFVLEKGSHISDNPGSSCSPLRTNLLREHQFKISGYVLREDIVFDTINQATTFVVASSANAYECWFTPEGVSLNSYRMRPY